MISKRFNVRVYGLCINHQQNILICDEHYGNQFFTKFPGGGLEFGEGIIQCLKREWKEELNIEIEVLSHFYTTEFFQASAFDGSQVISIYYLVKPSEMSLDEFTSYTHLLKNEETLFKWASLKKMKESDVTFPIDQKVASLLIERHASGCF
ncbi:MAG: NUDIX domain-containing protein [Chitinophagaceae bacterium]|nr:MAG: ADP-ribose pyrophosphatase [Bacteroidetes bacterium OLB11]MCC6448682.1 NUDIX domain-containing protein [Chitinophagaceae bacterium]